MLTVRNPWDITPIPNRGDATVDVTAAAKGRATSTWESFEVELSELYAMLTGHRHDDPAAMRTYGDPMNFKDRLTGLERVGEIFFRRKSCQILEGDFGDIILLAREFSARRNEIVHSIIRPVVFDQKHEVTESGGDKWTWNYQFYLVPPNYTDRKYDAKNRPAFIYTSKEIYLYEDWFNRAAAAAQNLSMRLRDPSYPPYGRKHVEQDV